MKKTRKKQLEKFLWLFIGSLITFTLTIVNNNYKENKHQNIIQKKEQITLIDKRLNEFYIPLKIKLDKSKRLWINYKRTYSNSKIFAEISNGKVSKDTLRWQRYMLSVFQPIHLELSLILSNKRDLALKNVKLDEQLNLLEQHIAYYNIIFMQWKYKDVTENFAPTHFPKNLSKFIKKDIERLNFEKEKLLTK